jgi:hypothetical protein
MARLAILIVSLLAHWFLYSAIFYLMRASLEILVTLSTARGLGTGLLSAFVGTDAPARAFVPSAPATALLTLVKKTASGELVPVAFTNGSAVSVFTKALKLPATTDAQGMSVSTLRSAQIIDAMLGSLLTCLVAIAVPTVRRLGGDILFRSSTWVDRQVAQYGSRRTQSGQGDPCYSDSRANHRRWHCSACFPASSSPTSCLSRGRFGR